MLLLRHGDWWHNLHYRNSCKTERGVMWSMLSGSSISADPSYVVSISAFQLI